MTLDKLETGDSAVIMEVGTEGALRQHFLDMGVIPHTDVMMVKKAPMGDPLELRIHGYELTLRKDDAAQIEIEKGGDSRGQAVSFADDFGTVSGNKSRAGSSGGKKGRKKRKKRK